MYSSCSSRHAQHTHTHAILTSYMMLHGTLQSLGAPNKQRCHCCQLQVLLPSFARMLMLTACVRTSTVHLVPYAAGPSRASVQPPDVCSW
jgi:hypothetical protein